MCGCSGTDGGDSSSGGNQTLAETLARGNTTDANDIRISNGQEIFFEEADGDARWGLRYNAATGQFFLTRYSAAGAPVDQPLQVSDTDGGVLLPSAPLSFGSPTPQSIQRVTASPEGVATANPGSLAMRDNNEWWRKRAGSGNTGWLLESLAGYSLSAPVSAGVDVTLPVGTTTLTGDSIFGLLTVPNGATLVTNGWDVTASTGILVQTGGVIHNDGTSGALGGAGAASGTLGPGTAGAAGGFGAGGAGTNQAIGIGSAAGGAGGAGSAGAGGAGGTIPGLVGGTQPFNSIFDAMGLTVSYDAGNQVFLVRGGGAGGGAGGGDGAFRGGGGGGGGGFAKLRAPWIDNQGTIRVAGGAGGNGAGGNAGGGGGGGGGRAVAVCRAFYNNAMTAPGGAAGAGVGTGVNGTAGTAGIVQVIFM